MWKMLQPLQRPPSIGKPDHALQPFSYSVPGLLMMASSTVKTLRLPSRAAVRVLDVGVGTGPPFLLLHSLGLDHGVWTPVADRLAPHRRVIAPDIAGHGPDAAEAPMTSIIAAADQMIELMDSLAIDIAVVAGISMGGAVAQEIAIRHPKRVAGLALLATMPKGFPVFIERAEIAERDGMAAITEGTMARWFNPADLAAETDGVRYALATLATTPLPAWAAAWRALAGHVAAERLPAISTPTICIVGENDPSTPPALVASIAAAIPGAQYKVIKDAPHLLTLTHPARVAELLLGLR
jgi:3-oxoadipate enol-lactonase